MSLPVDSAGTAALAICESLLLALNDRNILPEKEIVGILKNAAATHENAPSGDDDALNAAVPAKSWSFPPRACGRTCRIWRRSCRT